MDRQSIVQLHEGHEDFAIEPQWSGTFEEFAAANLEGVGQEGIDEVLDDLQSTGFHLAGGGAAASFTVCTPEFADREKLRRSFSANP